MCVCERGEEAAGVQSGAIQVWGSSGCREGRAGGGLVGDCG